MTDTTVSHDSPTAEPEYYPADVLLEEESFSWYTPELFYPIQIDELLNERYKVLVKLGYGSASTAWLRRDLEYTDNPRSHLAATDDQRRTQEYVTVKVYMTGHRQSLNEVQVLQHFETIDRDHPGDELIRRMTDTFTLAGKSRPHTCIVHQPCSLSLRDIRTIASGQIPSDILKPLVYGHHPSDLTTCIQRLK
ncbi:Putative protein kinase-like domain superfamily [Septoria linicola]|uniref:non-specific serine/threonine protein kinase n=1 Tax=Septoria linicola TaxID=215465 RepID=A0A9Q9B6Z9_9PEZI|nr:Putative protein kinase-like domain superfamily [Septoria linicola]